MSTLDNWIKSKTIKPVKKEEPTTLKKTEKKDAYVLPTGAVSIYFREGEGFIFHYDARTYREKHVDPNKALLTNLDILSIIWNKLIEMKLSPRYLSKAYDDNIYTVLLAPVEEETDDYMEVDKLRIHLSKHPLDAKIRDLDEWIPKIPEEIEKKMFDKGMDFQNPMLKYQELKSQEKKSEVAESLTEESEKPIEQKTTTTECKNYSNEYIKSLIEKDPFIYDPRYQKIWYRSEFEYAYANNDWHTNSGHFDYVVQCWKKNGGDKEELLDIIHQYKDKHLHTLLKYWEKDLKKHIDNTKEFAKSRDIKYTEIWRQHAINTWRELNLIREELKLKLLQLPEILNYSTREIIIKVLSESDENILDKYTEPTKNNNQSESLEEKKDKPKEDKSEKKFICELCGRKTDKLHEFTGRYAEFFPKKKVCMDCYINEYKKFYEKYGVCPECGAKLTLKEWPNFICDNGHIINANFIKVNNRKLLDDVYGKLSPEEYKKLHDKIFTVADAIEEKYNKTVHRVDLVSLDKSLTGVAYISITEVPIKELKEKIREEEGIFAGLSVMFKDDFGNETWMNENLITIEKPQLVKKAEEYLRKVVQGYTGNKDNEASHPTISLNKWTLKGDFNG